MKIEAICTAVEWDFTPDNALVEVEESFVPRVQHLRTILDAEKIESVTINAGEYIKSIQYFDDDEEDDLFELEDKCEATYKHDEIAINKYAVEYKIHSKHTDDRIIIPLDKFMSAIPEPHVRRSVEEFDSYCVDVYGHTNWVPKDDYTEAELMAHEAMKRGEVEGNIFFFFKADMCPECMSQTDSEEHSTDCSQYE